MTLAIIFTVAIPVGLAVGFWSANAFGRFAGFDTGMVVGFNIGMLFAAICAWIGVLL